MIGRTRLTTSNELLLVFEPESGSKERIFGSAAKVNLVSLVDLTRVSVLFSPATWGTFQCEID